MGLLKNNSLSIGIIFFLSFIVYSNTFTHEFVLDDKIVITENSFTKKGIDGIVDIFSYDSMRGFFGGERNLVQGGRYRPLALATHAVEYEIVGKEPFFFHFNNVLLYSISGVLLFLILVQLFPSTSVWYLSVPLIATVLFQVSPLHTEVVANIKSRDEILSILFSFGAILFVLHYLKKSSIVSLIVASILFLLGLLSKESAVVMAGIAPLLIWVFKKDVSLKSIGIIFLTLIIPTFIYLAIRWQVIGGAQIETTSELMNNPFLNATTIERWATTAFVMLLYIKLLLWPHPLTHDYYPTQIPITDFSNPLVILAIVIHVLLIVVFIQGVLKRNIFGVITGLYLGGIILYSNILFQIGTFMNERFLYIPVLGLSILIAWLVSRFIKSQNARIILFMVLVFSYSAKTVARNADWESDAKLSITDVAISNNSAKAHLSAGIAYIDRAKASRKPSVKNVDIKKGIHHLKTAVELYPGYSPPVLLLGNAYTELKQYNRSIYYYELCLKANTQVSFALQNLEIVSELAMNEAQLDQCEKALDVLLTYRKSAKALELKGELYGKHYNKLPEAITYLAQASEMDPKNGDIIQKLGVAYALSGDNNTALRMFIKGVELDPMNANMRLNLSYAYRGVGENDKAEQSLQKAYELDPNLRPK
ncbi:MAG: hypothetical protein ACPGEG_00050 [Salibacteraceae bacterium]